MSDTNAFDDPNLNAPLQDLSPDNHGGWAWVAAFTSLIVTWITIVFKLWSRFRETKCRSPNDIWIILSGILAVIQTVTIILAVRYGLGQRRGHLAESTFESFEKAYYAGNVISIVLLGTAKAAVVHFLIDLKPPTRRLLQACHVTRGVVWAWTVGSVLALAFQCDLPDPWSSEGNKCIDQFVLNAVIHSFNVLTDLLLVAVPCLMMQKVKIQPRKRWVASGLFASRLIVPAITVIMLLSMRKLYGPADPDFTWHALAPQVCAQIMFNASIVAACIPSLKPVLAAIRPGLTVVNIRERELTSSYVVRSKKGNRSGETTSEAAAGSRFASRWGLSRSGGRDGGSSSIPLEVCGETQVEPVMKMERGHNRPRATKVQSQVVVEYDCSESVKGLTEGVIMHEIDYSVRVEDDGSSHDPDGDLTGRSETSSGQGRPGEFEHDQESRHLR